MGVQATANLLELGVWLFVLEQPFEVDIGYTVDNWVLVSLSFVQFIPKLKVYRKNLLCIEEHFVDKHLQFFSMGYNWWIGIQQAIPEDLSNRIIVRDLTKSDALTYKNICIDITKLRSDLTSS